MKNKHRALLIGLVSGAMVIAAGSIAGATYAAYNTDTPIGGSDFAIPSDGYKKADIFLDVSSVNLGSQENAQHWSDNGPLYLLWAWESKIASGTSGSRMFAASKVVTVNDIEYAVFHIPTALFTHCLFCRADPNKSNYSFDAGYNDKASDNYWCWNQTGDLPLYNPSKNEAAKVAYSYNLWRITGWNEATVVPSGFNGSGS